MDGSATLTMVMSRTIISIPVHSTTRAIQRERSVMGLPLRRADHLARSVPGRGPERLPAGPYLRYERTPRQSTPCRQTGVARPPRGAWNAPQRLQAGALGCLLGTGHSECGPAAIGGSAARKDGPE